MKFFQAGITVFLILTTPGVLSANDQIEVKGKHFVVLSHPHVGTTESRKILRHAERFYKSIAREIGYSRYSDFWTWEDRVKIVVYPDQTTFVAQTGQPPWSRGYASRDSAVFNSRAILTYKQEHDFYNGVLPHEIGHLILIDFLGEAAITTPIWFHEGVAQLQEGDKKSIAKNMMRYMVRNGAYIPLKALMGIDFRLETEPKRVLLLYAQSVSIIDFMISTYGSTPFGRLCQNIRDGLNFEEALRRSYPGSINNLEKLENKWVKSLSY